MELQASTCNLHVWEFDCFQCNFEPDLIKLFCQLPDGVDVLLLLQHGRGNSAWHTSQVKAILYVYFEAANILVSWRLGDVAFRQLENICTAMQWLSYTKTMCNMIVNIQRIAHRQDYFWIHFVLENDVTVT